MKLECCFYQVRGYLPHILVLNKKDRVPSGDFGHISRAIRAEDPSIAKVIFTNAKDSTCKGMKKVRKEGQSMLVVKVVAVYIGVVTAAAVSVVDSEVYVVVVAAVVIVAADADAVSVVVNIVVFTVFVQRDEI